MRKFMHREFDRRADAVIFAAGLEGRHEVGDVAHDEQFTRHGAEDRLGIDAAVGARDDHRLGVLPVGRELFVMVSIRNEVAVLETAVAVRQGFGKAAHWICLLFTILEARMSASPSHGSTVLISTM